MSKDRSKSTNPRKPGQRLHPAPRCRALGPQPTVPLGGDHLPRASLPAAISFRSFKSLPCSVMKCRQLSKALKRNICGVGKKIPKLKIRQKIPLNTQAHYQHRTKPRGPPQALKHPKLQGRCRSRVPRAGLGSRGQRSRAGLGQRSGFCSLQGRKAPGSALPAEQPGPGRPGEQRGRPSAPAGPAAPGGASPGPHNNREKLAEIGRAHV